MPNTVYPGSIDLERYLVAAGLFEYPLTQAQQAMDLDGFLRASISAFENATGFLPFLPTSAATTTRTFDGQGRNEIVFGGGLVSVLADGTPTAPVVSINSTIYNENFFSFKPNVAPQIGKPYRSIKFGRWQDTWLPVANGPSEDGITFLGTAQRVISITGIWGYSLTLPEDARQAILAKAALLAAPQLGLQISGGLYSVRDLNSEIRYGGGQLSTLSDQVKWWTGQYEQSVRRYQGYAL